MPGDGDNGASVSFSRLQPLVEPADVRVGIGLEPHGAGSGFYKSPFEIVVDVAAGSTMADAPTGCDDARHESCIAGQVFCVRESGNVAYLQPDQRRENFTQAGDGAQQPDRRGRFEHGSDARFDGLHLCFELVKGRELHLDHRGGMRWQLVDYAVDVDSSPDAEEIADAGGVQAVAVNGCVDAVLEGSAQIAQSHAGAQQFALIAQIAGRDPALGEGSIMQQDGESLGVEGIGAPLPNP